MNTDCVYSRIYYNYDDDDPRKINEEFGWYFVDPIDDGGYFKGLYLKNNYSAILYSTGQYNNYQVKLNISILQNDEETEFYSFETKEQKQIGSEYTMKGKYTPYEFIKINNNRLAFITITIEGIVSEYDYCLLITF